jgi:hypothetical protein
MKNFDPQTVVALALVGLSACYLAYKAVRALARRKKSSGCCGGCTTCPSGTQNEPAVVTLDALADSAQRR